MPYAAKTKVPVSRSRDEVERILERYGADAFQYGVRPSLYQVTFQAHDRLLRFEIPRPQEGTEAQRAQEERRLWRALVLAIKSRLECVESGLSTFEREFLPYVLLPGGRTVADWAETEIPRAIEAGAMPMLLAEGEAP